MSCWANAHRSFGPSSRELRWEWWGDRLEPERLWWRELWGAGPGGGGGCGPRGWGLWAREPGAGRGGEGTPSSMPTSLRRRPGAHTSHGIVISLSHSTPWKASRKAGCAAGAKAGAGAPGGEGGGAVLGLVFEVLPVPLAPLPGKEGGEEDPADDTGAADAHHDADCARGGAGHRVRGAHAGGRKVENGVVGRDPHR